MTQDTILAHLGQHPWAGSVQYMKEASSTNTLLKLLGHQNIPEGTVLIADRQTAGRGRMGRTFQSPGGVGIYFSVLLRPNCTPQELMHLTCATGVAICSAVEQVCGLRPGIKWINDLVIGNRKLGGILTELGLDLHTGKVDFAVIGIGINCCQKAEDFDPSIRDMAISLEQAVQAPVDRSRLAAEMVRQMELLNQQLLTNRSALMDQYRRDCITIGQQVQVIQGDSIRPALAIGMDDFGALQVRYEDGSAQFVSSGEVSVRGMYGYL